MKESCRDEGADALPPEKAGGVEWSELVSMISKSDFISRVLQLKALPLSLRPATLEAILTRWPGLRGLYVSGNPGPSDALGRALAAALPSLPNAETFYLHSSGLGQGAAAELRAAKAAVGSDVRLHLGDGEDTGDDY